MESRRIGRSMEGNPAGNRYAALHQVNRSNVQDLQVAWTYHSADTAAAQRPASAHDQ